MKAVARSIFTVLDRNGQEIVKINLCMSTYGHGRAVVGEGWGAEVMRLRKQDEMQKWFEIS